MMRCLGVLCLLVGAATVSAQTEVTGVEDRVEEVRVTEIAFAQTMADRDLDAFRSFLDEEAVFFAGAAPLRGPDAIVTGWRVFFQDEEAPFSWEPEVVEVLASGRLALSSGTVTDADGVRMGTFQSIWRRNDDGEWRIVFDKGCDWCPDR